MKKTAAKEKCSVSKTESKKDFFQEVTDKIIETLETGVAPWKKSWVTHGTNSFPVNAISERRYSGINVILLWLAANENGFISNRWLTFQQALNAGGNVIKGAKGTSVSIYRPFEKPRTDKNGKTVFDDTGKEILDMSFFASKFTLFNVMQCENLAEEITMMPKLPVLPELERLVRADQLIAASKVKIVHRRQNRAFYQPAIDQITMPLMGQFDETENYYSTILHELTHATGHGSRLNRDGITHSTKKSGDSSYAFEELVAEIGSAFLCAELGIEGDVLQHESYIGSWIKHLKEDSKAIFRASRYAREAFEYLLTQESLKRAA